MTQTEPNTDEEIQKRFFKVFRREMTREERRCFFLPENRQTLVANVNSGSEANPLSVECVCTKPYTATAYPTKLDRVKLLYVCTEEKRPASEDYR